MKKTHRRLLSILGIIVGAILIMGQFFFIPHLIQQADVASGKVIIGTGLLVAVIGCGVLGISVHHLMQSFERPEHLSR